MANTPIKSLKINGSTYDFVDNEARETKADITYVNKTFSNTLEGIASGNYVTINNISPNNHELSVKVSSDTITDLTSVKVTEYGENLIDGNLRTAPRTTKNVTIRYLPDEGCYLLNGTASATSIIYQLTHNIFLDDDVTLTSLYVSGSITYSGYTGGVFYVSSVDNIDGTPSNWACVNLRNSNSQAISTSSKPYLAKSWFYIYNGTIFDNYKIRLITEKGKNSNTEYIPSTDGTVSGIVSKYPVTILATSNSEASLDVKYAKDLNNYFNTIKTQSTDYTNKTHYGYSGDDLLIIPDGTTTIDYSNGYENSAYKCIVLPDSVVNITNGAFQNCGNLKEIIFGNGLEYIGESAFADCSSLTSITIPDSVTSIDVNAFNGCSGLTSITIPNSVTSIGEVAFYDCPLETIDLTAYTTQSFPTLGTGNFDYITSDYQIKVVKGRKAELASMTNWSACADHIVEVPTVETVDAELSEKAPTSHASSSTTYGVSSASNYGHAMASSTTPKANGTAAVGSETAKFARGDHVHPLQTTVSGNAGTATKLATARSINLGTGVTSTATNFDGSSNITIPVTSVKESYLAWGGKNFSSSYGPLDASMIPALGANRLAFIPPKGVTLQYSRDGGSTWSNLDNEDTKRMLFSAGSSQAPFIIGNDTSTGIDKSNYMARVILRFAPYSEGDYSKLYTELNKFAIYCSTSGSQGSYCTIDARLESDRAAGNDTWRTFASQVQIAGWSGWNIINISNLTTYGNSSNKTMQYGELRFTFGVTSHSTTVKYPGLRILNIMGFGGVGWGTPSNMAQYGSIYSYDPYQNVQFPGIVKATKFQEDGTSLVNKYAAKAHTHSYLPLSGGTLTGDTTVTAGKSIQLNTLKIPTSSGGSTYGVGSSGQVLKSNGTTVYWASSDPQWNTY